MGGSVTLLTKETFKQKIFNYEPNKEWKFLGDKPAIIDFYADCCGSCRMVSPLVEEIAKDYAGRINVYKVDTDKEQKLSQSLEFKVFQPCFLYLSMENRQLLWEHYPKKTLC